MVGGREFLDKKNTFYLVHPGGSLVHDRVGSSLVKEDNVPGKPDATGNLVPDDVFRQSSTLFLLLHKSNMGSICPLTYLWDESDLREIGDD